MLLLTYKSVLFLHITNTIVSHYDLADFSISYFICVCQSVLLCTFNAIIKSFISSILRFSFSYIPSQSFYFLSHFFVRKLQSFYYFRVRRNVLTIVLSSQTSSRSRTYSPRWRTYTSLNICSITLYLIILRFVYYYEIACIIYVIVFHSNKIYCNFLTSYVSRITPLIEEWIFDFMSLFITLFVYTYFNVVMCINFSNNCHLIFAVVSRKRRSGGKNSNTS